MDVRSRLRGLRKTGLRSGAVVRPSQKRRSAILSTDRRTRSRAQLELAHDAKRFNVKMPDNIVMTLQDRAYTSPIWYTP